MGLENKAAYAPLVAIQLYLSVTVLMFVSGVIQWPVPNYWLVLSFIAIYQVSFSLGFISKTRAIVARAGVPAGHGSNNSKNFVTMIFRLCLTVSIIWILPKFAYFHKQSIFDIGSVFSKVIHGVFNPGDGYRDRRMLLDNFSIMYYLNAAVYPVFLSAISIGVFQWKTLTKKCKMGVVAIIGFDALAWMSIGTNKGVADYFAMIPILVIAGNRNYLGALTFKRVAIALLIIALLSAIFIAAFSYNITGRANFDNNYFEQIVERNSNVKAYPILRDLPVQFQASVIYLFAYLTQGYYSLSLCLEEPFVFCYGVGNSPFFLSNYFYKFTGIDVADQTYPARIEKNGIHRFLNWHTIYSWLASDFSFYGVIVIMYLLGRLFADVWTSALVGVNPFAAPMLSLMSIMAFYIPANNQILAFAPSGISLFLIFPLWLYFNNKR